MIKQRLQSNKKLRRECICVKSLQSCPLHKGHKTLYDPVDYSPLGFSVYGIIQARIVEWVAMPSSRESYQTREQTHISCGSFHCSQILYH